MGREKLRKSVARAVRAVLAVVCTAAIAGTPELLAQVPPSAPTGVRIVPAEESARSMLRSALAGRDMARVFDRLTRLDLSARSDVVRAARCVASGDCSTRYQPVAQSLAPEALAAVLGTTRDARAGIEQEAVALLDAFRARRHDTTVDMVDAVTFFLTSASTAYGTSPAPSQVAVFRRALQRALSRNGAFQATTHRERQMAAELCEILGMHLLEEAARQTRDDRGHEGLRHYAARVAYSAFNVQLSELHWSEIAQQASRQ